MSQQSPLERVAGRWNEALEEGATKAVSDAKQFEQLEGADPELAQSLTHVLESRSNATEWLTSPNRILDGELPIAVLASGRRQEVVDTLIRLEYGIYH